MKKIILSLIIIFCVMSNSVFAKSIVVDSNMSYIDYGSRLRMYTFTERVPSNQILRTHVDVTSGIELPGIKDLDCVESAYISQNALVILLTSDHEWSDVGEPITEIISMQIDIDKWDEIYNGITPESSVKDTY